MITFESFMDILRPLGAIMTDDLTDEAAGVYYDVLKRHRESYLRRAVSRIKETYRRRSWPAIGIFTEAIDVAKAEDTEATLQEIRNRYDGECPKCLNMGWDPGPWDKPYEKNGYRYVKYCDCPAGRRMKRAHEERKKGKK